jgi:hypothetical protein
VQDESETVALFETLVEQSGVPLTTEIKQDITACVRKSEQSCLALVKQAASLPVRNTSWFPFSLITVPVFRVRCFAGV